MSFRTLLDVGLIYVFGYEKKKDDWRPMPFLPLAIMELPGSVGCQSVRRHGHWCLQFCDTEARGLLCRLEEGLRVNPVLPMLMLTSHPEGKGSLRREAEP